MASSVETINSGATQPMGRGLVVSEDVKVDHEVEKRDFTFDTQLNQNSVGPVMSGTAGSGAGSTGKVRLSGSEEVGKCEEDVGRAGELSKPALPFAQESKIQFNETEITALSGALAGFLAGVIVCPLDVAKTRLQAQGLQVSQGSGSNSAAAVKTGAKYYNGIWGTLTTIVKDESVRGLYKGIVPIVLGYFPTWMIYFSVYEKCKLKYPKVFPHSEFLTHSMSALTAGGISTTLTNPVWVVKTRLMLQSGKNVKGMTHYKNTLDAFVKIYKGEGIKSFYSGLIPSLFGLFHVAIHFPVYELLKKKLHCYPTANSGNQDHSLHLGRLIVASCGSKMIASALTYPHEILRTRLQVKSEVKPTIKFIVQSTFMREGIKGFYSGFLTNMFRTVPASAITLVSFEYFRKHFKLWNEGLAV